MSLPTSNSSASQKVPPSPRLRRPPRLRYVIALPLMVLIGSCVVTQGPREVGRWKLAAALDLRARSDKEQAYDQLAAAMRWLPGEPMLMLQRAEWRWEDGEKQAALSDADQMLKLGDEGYQWLVVHSHFMQTAGEHERAVEDWKKIKRESERTGTPGRAVALNGLAYARAVAGVEIDEALEDVNQALELAPRSAAILDTRAFVLYLSDKKSALELALKDMNLAVSGMNEDLEALKQRVGRQKRRAELFASQTPKMWSQALPEWGDEANAISTAERSAAVGHYHRALIFEALGRTAGAEADREAARKLIGKEPDETLF